MSQHFLKVCMIFCVCVYYYVAIDILINECQEKFSKKEEMSKKESIKGKVISLNIRAKS